MSEGDNERRSLNKDKLFVRKVADIIPKVCGNLKQFSRGHGESGSRIRISITSTENESKCGPGFRKFNNLLLIDKDYVELIC